VVQSYGARSHALELSSSSRPPLRFSFWPGHRISIRFGRTGQSYTITEGKLGYWAGMATKLWPAVQNACRWNDCLWCTTPTMHHHFWTAVKSVGEVLFSNTPRTTPGNQQFWWLYSEITCMTEAKLYLKYITKNGIPGPNPPIYGNMAKSLRGNL
jgi:hypothetical protein